MFLFDFIVPKVKLEKKSEKEDVLKLKLKYKGPLDIEGLYKKMYGWLKDNDWKDSQVEKDYYEKTYYERVTREGLKFYDFTFEAKKNFNEKEPKIDHFISVRVIVAPYDPNKKTGSIQMEFKAWREYEKMEANVFNYLAVGKKAWEKSYKKLLKDSKKSLIGDLVSFRDEIAKYLTMYMYK